MNTADNTPTYNLMGGGGGGGPPMGTAHPANLSGAPANPPPQVGAPQSPGGPAPGWGGAPQAAPMWGGGTNYGTNNGGMTGTQGGAGGNFFEGLGNYFGFGRPTTIGQVDAPVPDQNGYLLGGSAGASQGAYDAAGQRAEGYNGRDFGLNLGQANRGLNGAYALRGAEGQTTNMLMDAANGKGPSAAETTYLRAADDATKRSAGMAFAGRGGQGLLGARTAAETTFEGTQNAANEAGNIRANEMNAARGLLLQNLAQRNQAELGRAGMGLQMGQAGADVNLRGAGLNDAAAQAEYARQMQIMQLNQQGLMGWNQQASSNWGTAAGLNMQGAQTNLQQQNAQDAKRGALVGNVIKGAAGLFGGAAGAIGGAIGGLF